MEILSVAFDLIVFYRNRFFEYLIKLKNRSRVSKTSLFVLIRVPVVSATEVKKSIKKTLAKTYYRFDSERVVTLLLGFQHHRSFSRSHVRGHRREVQSNAFGRRTDVLLSPVRLRLPGRLSDQSLELFQTPRGGHWR